MESEIHPEEYYLAKEAFAAGYKEREVGAREDTDLTEQVIERKFEKWWAHNHE